MTKSITAIFILNFDFEIKKKKKDQTKLCTGCWKYPHQSGS